SVHHRHRKGAEGLRLLKALKAWSKLAASIGSFSPWSCRKERLTTILTQPSTLGQTYHEGSHTSKKPEMESVGRLRIGGRGIDTLPTQFTVAPYPKEMPCRLSLDGTS